MSDTASAPDPQAQTFVEQCRQWHFAIQGHDVSNAAIEMMSRFSPAECLLVASKLQQLVWAQLTVPEEGEEGAIQE